MGRGVGGSHHQLQLGPEEGSQWSVVDRPPWQLGPAGEGTLWLGEGRPHLLEEVAGGRAVGDKAAGEVGNAALGMLLELGLEYREVG